MISSKEVKIDPVKVKIISDWPQSKNLKDVQNFLSLANFYQRFIYAYSNLIVLLINFIKKEIFWE